MATLPDLDALRKELAAMFAAMAFIADECYMPGSGYRMLGRPEGDHTPLDYRMVDVDRSALGKMLPIWYSYAFDATVPAGYNIETWERTDGELERLSDLIGLFKLNDPYFEDCMASVWYEEIARQPDLHLGELYRRLSARLALDTGQPLNLGQIALLADMNERSVRNAIHGDEDKRLIIEPDDTVSAEEAKRWLAGRRNFKPTVRRTLPSSFDEQPDALSASEIPPFVRQRLRLVEKTWGDYPPRTSSSAYPQEVQEAAARSGLSPETIISAMDLPLSIRPEDCIPLAELLRLDVAWFTHQVMFALYPQQMDVVVNPRNWRTASAPLQPQDEPMKSVVVELTPGMLAHGYLDMPAEARALFSGNDFGAKGSGFVGTTVELRYGGHTTTTDIREKSQKTIAPRKRFTAWFNSELRAKPGDRIRVDKTDEGVYTLTHLPV